MIKLIAQKHASRIRTLIIFGLSKAIGMFFELLCVCVCVCAQLFSLLIVTTEGAIDRRTIGRRVERRD